MISNEIFFLLLVGGAAFAFGLVMWRTLRRLKSDAPEYKQLNLGEVELDPEFMNSVTQRYGDSLELSDALDQVFEYLQEVIPFSLSGYVLRKGNDKLLYKANLLLGVSEVFVEEVKRRLSEGLKDKLGETTAHFSIEDYVRGGPVNESNPAAVRSFFSVPFYMNDELVGMVGVASVREHVYNDSIISTVRVIFGEVMHSLSILQAVVTREKEKLQTLVDGMNEGVILLDKDFRILVINPAVSSLLQQTQATDLNILDVVNYFSGTVPLEDTVSKVFATGGSEVFSEVCVGDKYYEITVIPISNEDKVIRVGILIEDRTKEEELDRLQREFSAMVIHDLRSPLSVIKGAADLLINRSDTISDAQKIVFLNQINESASSLLDMVGDLLDAAKVEEGKVELFKETFGLNNLLNEEKDYYYNLGQQRGVNLTVSLDDSVGQVSADPKKIRQVLNNLISNAIKFTDNGGQVSLFSKNLGGAVQVVISDTGKGVPDDLKERLFDKFVQGRGSEDKGTGLGLAIAKGIIEAHGGKIWIEDNQPKGAKFIFTLPYS